MSWRVFSASATLILGLMILSISAWADEKPQSALVAVPIISQLVKKQASGEWGGALIDVLRQAEKKSQIPFKLKIVPFKRAVMMTKQGQADFGVFLESPKRNQMAMPVLKLGQAMYVVVSLKKNKITSLDQLTGKTIGKIRGGNVLNTLSAIPDLKYYPFNTHDDGIRLLKGERIDAVITTNFRVTEAVEKSSLSYDEIAKPVPIEGRGLWLYWSLRSEIDFKHIKNLKYGGPVTIDGLMPNELLGRESIEPNNASFDKKNKSL